MARRSAPMPCNMRNSSSQVHILRTADVLVCPAWPAHEHRGARLVAVDHEGRGVLEVVDHRGACRLGDANLIHGGQHVA